MASGITPELIEIQEEFAKNIKDFSSNLDTIASSCLDQDASMGDLKFCITFLVQYLINGITRIELLAGSIIELYIYKEKLKKRDIEFFWSSKDVFRLLPPQKVVLFKLLWGTYMQPEERITAWNYFDTYLLIIEDWILADGKSLLRPQKIPRHKEICKIIDRELPLIIARREAEAADEFAAETTDKMKVAVTEDTVILSTEEDGNEERSLEKKKIIIETPPKNKKNSSSDSVANKKDLISTKTADDLAQLASMVKNKKLATPLSIADEDVILLPSKGNTKADLGTISSLNKQRNSKLDTKQALSQKDRDLEDRIYLVKNRSINTKTVDISQTRKDTKREQVYNSGKKSQCKDDICAINNIKFVNKGKIAVGAIRKDKL